MVLASPEEYDEAFRERFVRAVKVRMRACSPIGCMLSGGFDSSSIMCTAYDIADLDGKKKSHTFSSLFPSLPQCDERRYIEAALAGKECVPHFSAGDEISPFEHQAEIISLLAEPTEGMYHTHVALLQAAREHGVRVLLDGSDGDITLFEDFFYLSELALRDRWLRFIAEARQVARIHGLSLSVLFWQYGIRRRLSRRFKDLVRWIFRLKPGRYMDGAMLRPEFAARMNQEERILASVRALQARIRTVRDFQRMLLVSNAVGLGNESLSLIGVWQGVESRFPYYDRDLVEFCLALPPSEKLHRGFARYIGRRSLETLLPEEICWRSTKSEFNDVLAHGMYRFGADRLRELLRHEVLAEYVDTVRLKSAYERFLSKRYTPNDLTNIWRLCSFSHWLQAVSPHSARDRKKNVYC
jgi:asparagine synthase (glutamine-hydrolysing)